MNEMNHYTITRYVSICLNFESTLRVSESVWLWATSARSALHWQFRQADACGASVFPWEARSLQHGGNTVFPEGFFAKGKHVATISNICLEPDVVAYYSVHLPRLFVTKSLYRVNRTVQYGPEGFDLFASQMLQMNSDISWFQVWQENKRQS